jgi:hypothetical protein
MRGLFLVALVTVAALLAAVPTANACSCARLTPELMLANGTAVFEGRAVGRGRGGRVLFEVIRRYKGAHGQRITVTAPPGPEMCPIPDFTIGTTYLVMAEGPVDALLVGGCNPSRPSSEAREDIAALVALAARR